MRTFILLVLFCFTSLSQAAVLLAFVEIVDNQGKVVKFDGHSPWGHVAISYRGQWLHAHPQLGVTLSKDLSDIGAKVAILESSDFDEPSEEFVKSKLGKPFDIRRPWDDKNFYYCAKLIAEWLGFQPTPMSFKSEGWARIARLPRNMVGLSAEDIFRQAIHAGFKKWTDTCPSRLTSIEERLKNLGLKQQ